MIRNLLYTCLVFAITTMTFAEIINIPEDFETIQAGIEASEDGDVVLVEPGVYVENIDFIGRAIIVASLIHTTDNPAYIYSTIIDGNGEECVVSFDTDEDSSSVLKGFTIRNGYQLFGGGIDCQAGTSPLLLDLYITENAATHFGGGVYFAIHSVLYLRRSIVSDNRASYGGGIASGDAPEAFLHDVIIRNNEAIRNGGGIYAESATYNLVNVSITDNRAQKGGGFLGVSSHGNIMQNVTVSRNTADEVGGLYFWARVERDRDVMAATISNSIIRDNGVQIFHGRTEHRRDYHLSIEYTDLEGGRDGIQTENEPELQWGEGNFDEDPLFRNPDAGEYQLTSQSPCIDTGNPESPEDPDETRADLGAFFFDQRLEEQAFEIREGWSIMSLAVQLENNEILNVMSQLLERGCLSMLKNHRGRFFSPEFNFCNIPFWDINNGYLIKLSEAAEFYILGLAIPDENEIPLREGWNIIAYHPEGEMAPETALESIENQLQTVKDQDGNFWNIPNEFNNLPDLTRNQGYQVQVNRDCTLIFPDDDE